MDRVGRTTLFAETTWSKTVDVVESFPSRNTTALSGRDGPVQGARGAPRLDGGGIVPTPRT
jgi:hypothetical protein